MAHFILTKTYRTKSEAKDAIKRGEVIYLQNSETGKVYEQMTGGPIDVRGKLDHYKEWTGEVICDRGPVVRIK